MLVDAPSHPSKLVMCLARYAALQVEHLGHLEVVLQLGVGLVRQVTGILQYGPSSGF